MTSSQERSQLSQSIEKLFHYIFPYVRKETTVKVFSKIQDEPIFQRTYVVPEKVYVSGSLYSRIDDCHGAGNCCRVPFDLVYTPYDRERILSYDDKVYRDMYGADSADRFQANRENLLATLEPCAVEINSGGTSIRSTLYVKRNTVEFELSGTKSCPYLFIGGERYFCGVHPFKPLHCWYPHMVVRVTEKEIEGKLTTAVGIGRMQYGRNHKFGCPVLFKEVPLSEEEGLFQVGPDNSELYFKEQFASDIGKLEWTSRSANSLGMIAADNFVVGIDQVFRNQAQKIRSCLRSSDRPQIQLWSKSS